MNNNKKVMDVKPPKKHSIKKVIIGLSQLFGVLSIVYSTAYIVLGTDGLAPLVLVAPQAVLAALIFVNKFCK